MENKIYDEVYSKLGGKLVVLYVTGWLLITLLEILLGIFIVTADNFTGSVLNYFIIYAAVPSITDAIIITVFLVILKNKHVKQIVKNYAIVTSLLLIALVLSICHGYFLIALCAFILPVLVATVFLDKKTFFFSIISSVAGVLISSIANLVLEPGSNRTGKLYVWGSALIVVLVLTVATIICGLMLQIYSEREKVLIKTQDENAKLSKENKADGLTGLQNHTSFYNVLENTLSKARHEKRGFAIAMLDIDDFKGINDTYGHGVGDDVLRHVSSTIEKAVGKGGVPFRYGGDEFAIIFNNPEIDDNIKSLELLRKSVANDDSLFSARKRVTLSIGYYNVKEVSMSSEEIFYKADQALYQAKYSGKNQVHAEY